MAGAAVGQQFQQHRPVPGPALLDRGLGRLVHGQHVVAVDLLAADAVAGGPAGDVRVAHHLRDVRAGAVEVVLADEDHRQVPDGGHVHAFVERALGHRAVAEETGDHLVALLHLEGQRHAGGHGNAAGDDGDAGDHALGHVAHVHAAALALAAAGGCAEQLVEQFLHGQALGQGVPVPAEGGGDEIVLPQGGAHAHGGRLLALALVDRARHDAFEEEELDALLELPNAHHPLVQSEQEIRVRTGSAVRPGFEQVLA